MTFREGIHHLATCVVALFTNCTNQRLDSIQGLLVVARALGCRVEFHPGIIPSYSPDEHAPIPSGLLVVNNLDAVDDTLRHLVHELTHHVLYWWETYFVTDQRMLQTTSDRFRLKEEVCHDVANILGAVPSGLQWNGKLAAPVGTNIRFYRQYNAPSFMSFSDEDYKRYGLKVKRCE